MAAREYDEEGRASRRALPTVFSSRRRGPSPLVDDEAVEMLADVVAFQHESVRADIVRRVNRGAPPAEWS